jgi:phage-related protein
MAFNIGAAVATIKADISQFQTSIKTIRSDITDVNEHAQSASAALLTVGRTVAIGVGVAYGALAGGITTAAKASWDQVAAVEESSFALRAYEKDGAKVNTILKDLIAYARSDMGVLFNRQELFQAASTLRGFGDDASKVTEHVKVLAKGVSLGMTGFGELSQIIGRAASAGKLDAETFDMLASRGIILSSSFRGAKVTTEKLYKELNRVLPDSLLGGRANTISGHIVRLESAFRDLGAAVLGVDKSTTTFIKGGLGDEIIKGFETLRQLLKSPEIVEGLKAISQGSVDTVKGTVAAIKSAVEFYEKYRTIINNTAIVIGSIFVPALMVTTAELIRQNVVMTYQTIKAFVLWTIEGWKTIAMLIRTAVSLAITTGAIIFHTAVLIGQAIAMGVATAATWLLNAALAVLTSPITLIILAIVALVAVIYLLVKNWSSITPIFQAGVDFLMQIFQQVADWFSNLFAQIGTSIAGSAQGIATALAPVGAVFQWLYTNVVQPIMMLLVAIVLWAFDQMVLDTVGKALLIVQGINDFLIQPTIQAFQFWTQVITDFCLFLFNMVIMPIFASILSYITTVWTGLVAVTTAVWNVLLNGVIVPMANNIRAYITAVWTGILGVTSTLWNAAASVINAAMAWARDNVTNIVNGIRQFLSDTWNGIVGFFVGIGNSIKNAIVQPFEDAKRAIEQIAQQIKDAANKINPYYRNSPSLVDNVRSGVSDIIDEYKSLREISLPKVTQMLTGAASPALANVPVMGGGQAISVTVNLDGAMIADEFGAQSISEKIGDSIIKKLQTNIKF